MSNIYHFIHKVSQTYSHWGSVTPLLTNVLKILQKTKQQNWRWEQGSWIPITLHYPRHTAFPTKCCLFSAAGHCQKTDSFQRYPRHYNEISLTPASSAVQKFSNTSFSGRARIHSSHEVSFHSLAYSLPNQLSGAAITSQALNACIPSGWFWDAWKISCSLTIQFLISMYLAQRWLWVERGKNRFKNDDTSWKHLLSISDTRHWLTCFSLPATTGQNLKFFKENSFGLDVKILLDMVQEYLTCQQVMVEATHTQSYKVWRAAQL